MRVLWELLAGDVLTVGIVVGGFVVALIVLAVVFHVAAVQAERSRQVVDALPPQQRVHEDEPCEWVDRLIADLHAMPCERTPGGDR